MIQLLFALVFGLTLFTLAGGWQDARLSTLIVDSAGMTTHESSWNQLVHFSHNAFLNWRFDPLFESIVSAAPIPAAYVTQLFYSCTSLFFV